MKSLRYIKLRTACKTPRDLILEHSSNPLGVDVEVAKAPQSSITNFLRRFKGTVQGRSEIYRSWVNKEYELN